MADFLLTASIPWIAALFLQGWRLLLFYQQEEYDSQRFLSWARRRIRQLFPRRVLLVWVASVLLAAVLAVISNGPIALLLYLAASWVGGAAAAFLAAAEIRRPSKLKLAYTLRIYRILIVLLAVCLLTVHLIAWSVAFLGLPAGWSLALTTLLYGGLFYAAPLLITAAGLLLMPFERLLQGYYLGASRRKIHKVDPVVIGITGSYGKTSTKEILAHLLAGTKNVLATPKSYNTLLGISKVINGTLQSGHEIFVVEMGAYLPGEIERICDLVHPRVGAITAIGPQHLERFGTLENVARAKFELIKALPSSGTALFSADDPFTWRFQQQSGNRKVVLVATQAIEAAHLAAEEIKTGPRGLSFTLVDRRTGERQPCKVKLLGRHNVSNILFASAIALELGMTLAAIAERAATLAPVQHRLQLLERANGVTVIDDAYNTNPVGAAIALETLASFEGGRKILITPGMVELGPLEKQANDALGRQAAGVCDFVILVGPSQTAPIRAGLLACGFPADRLFVAASLQEAISILDRTVASGDTVLFLNDLPDLYSETS